MISDKTARKKEKRNTDILTRYKQLREIKTKADTAREIIADEYNLSTDTIKKILFKKDYSCSPLIQPEEPAAEPGQSKEKI